MYRDHVAATRSPLANAYVQIIIYAVDAGPLHGLALGAQGQSVAGTNEPD